MSMRATCLRYMPVRTSFASHTHEGFGIPCEANGLRHRGCVQHILAARGRGDAALLMSPTDTEAMAEAGGDY